MVTCPFEHGLLRKLRIAVDVNVLLADCGVEISQLNALLTLNDAERVGRFDGVDFDHLEAI